MNVRRWREKQTALFDATMFGLAHRLRQANAEKHEVERRIKVEAEKHRRMFSAFQKKKASPKLRENYPLDQSIEIGFQRLRSHTQPPDEDACAARKPRPKSPALDRLKIIHQHKPQVLKSSAKRGRRAPGMGRYSGHQSVLGPLAGSKIAFTPKLQVTTITADSVPSLKRHEAVRIRQIANDQMNGKPSRSFYSLRANEVSWGLDPRFKRGYSMDSLPLSALPRPAKDRSLYLKRPW